MSTNHWLGTCDGNQPEADLIEDLTIEVIKMKGCDMYYIPREIVNEDYFYQEDLLSQFTKSYLIEMYLATVDEFQGDGDFLSKFGLEIRDSAEFVVSKLRFETEVTSVESNIKRPREGDLLYFPLTNGLFEIKFVEHENPFYQIGKLYTYRLSVELFRYSSEELDTGIPNVDAIQDEFENVDDSSTDPFASNQEIEDEANDATDPIIDPEWDDKDPFGGF